MIGLVFDRREKSREGRGRLLGVGHAIVDRALAQMSNVDASVAIIASEHVPGPLFVFRVSNRVTDRGDVRPVICALLFGGNAGQGRLLHDWQLLKLLNDLPPKSLAELSEDFCLPSRDEWGGHAQLLRSAVGKMETWLPGLGLEFELPFLEVVAAILPDKR